MPSQMHLTEFESTYVVRQLFFALRPPPPVAQQLSGMAADINATLNVRTKPLPANRLHVTLLDLGAYASTPRGLLASACEAATKVKLPPFEVGFDRVTGFKNSRNNPLVLRATTGANAELTEFQLALHMELAKAGLKARLISVPHVTLMYDRVLHAEQRIEPVQWTAQEFLLIESLQGFHIHNIVGTWPLKG